MCRMRNIAMCDYRTDRHTQTERQTDARQSDPYVPLCFTGDTKRGKSQRQEGTLLYSLSGVKFY